MTVIAFDSKILAADRMLAIDNIKVECTKIKEYPDCVIGTAGSGMSMFEFEKWVEAGRPEDAEHDSDSGDDDIFSALLVERTGKKRLLFFNNSYTPIDIESKILAIGSGGEIAMTAMKLGKNAIEAAQVACDMCYTCGMGINSVVLFK